MSAKREVRAENLSLMFCALINEGTSVMLATGVSVRSSFGSSSFNKTRFLNSTWTSPHWAFRCCFLSLSSLTNLTPTLLKILLCSLYFVKLSPSRGRRTAPCAADTDASGAHPAAFRMIRLGAILTVFHSVPCCFNQSSLLSPDTVIRVLFS